MRPVPMWDFSLGAPLSCCKFHSIPLFVFSRPLFLLLFLRFSCTNVHLHFLFCTFAQFYALFSCSSPPLFTLNHIFSLVQHIFRSGKTACFRKGRRTPAIPSTGRNTVDFHHKIQQPPQDMGGFALEICLKLPVFYSILHVDNGASTQAPLSYFYI